MEATLPLETYELSIDGERIVWPTDISNEAYSLIYTYSKLSLNKATPDLYHAQLYEAWAFDGKKSWHIWNRDGKWVCTVYDTEKDDESMFIQREQLLLNHIAKTVQKEKLIIHERIAFDEDEQAYIAYARPIKLSN